MAEWTKALGIRGEGEEVYAVRNLPMLSSFLRSRSKEKLAFSQLISNSLNRTMIYPLTQTQFLLGSQPKRFYIWNK